MGVCKMTGGELAEQLAWLYRAERGIGILLFGTRYSREIDECWESVQEIVGLSGVPTSYVCEVYEGIRLAPYVSVRNFPARP